jgi:hypothetical protein
MFLNNLLANDMSVKGIFKKTSGIMYKKNSSQNCTNILILRGGGTLDSGNITGTPVLPIF